jgi:sRNA-binding carbon storage regulator CsrA
MLALGRKLGQRILIGPIGAPTVTLQLVRMRGYSVEIESNGVLLELQIGSAIPLAEGISVRLLTLDRRHARFGVLAPRDVPVHREEIALKIAGQRPRGFLRLPFQASRSAP